MKYLIAHDLGTSGNKATLFTTDGELVSSVTCAYDTHFFNGTWAEQNPEDWWNAVCESNRILLKNVDKKAVAGLAFSGQMMACVLVDKTHRPLRRAIIWADQRSREQEQRIRDRIDEARFYRITGHKISASYSMEKLMWVRDREPEIYQAAHKMLNPKDYVIGRLTGAFATDYSDASGTNCFDLNALDWSDEILQAAGIPRELLPDAYPSTHVAGEVTASVAAECGLAPGTPIILGGGDGVCASVGAGSVREGLTYNYMGSSAWIALCSEKPIYDEQLRTFNFAHMVPGMYSPTGSMQAAGNSYSFAKNVLCDGLAYDLMNEAMAQSTLGANGLLFLPYLLGERSPRWNSNARGAFIGLKMEHTKADLLRATAEGILMNMAVILDIFRDHVPIGEMNIIGGLVKGGPVRRLLADIYGVRAVKLAHLDEATSMGAAVAAGVGAGVLPSFDAIDRFIRVDDIIEPDLAAHRAYGPLREVFDESYFALLDVYDKLAKF